VRIKCALLAWEALDEALTLAERARATVPAPATEPALESRG